MGTVYWVECRAADGHVIVSGSYVEFAIDHHRTGDPGYGRPPEEFLSASSIGQVIAELARFGRLPEPAEGGRMDAPWSYTHHYLPHAAVGTFLLRRGVYGSAPGAIFLVSEDEESGEGYGRRIPLDIVLTAAASGSALVPA